MAKYKIVFIGLFSQLCLFSCHILNSNIPNDQEYKLDQETRREKRELNPDSDNDYDEDDTKENQDFEAFSPELRSDLSFELDIPSPPPKLVLNVNVYLDKDWTTISGTRGRKNSETYFGFLGT